MPKLLNHRLPGLQSLRGIAALAVVVQHVTYYSSQVKGIDYLPFLRFDFGRFGVQLFFVISGFVMSGCLSQGRRFLLNRFLRIYPAFWLSVAASYLFLSNPVFGWSFSWKPLLLIPVALNSTYRVPYWTLIYEIAFYIAVYLLILLNAKRDRVTKACIAWLIAVVVFTKYLTLSTLEPGAWILLSRSNVYFIFGMLVGLHFEEASRVSSLVLAVAASVLWCIGDTFAGAAPLPSDLVLALAFCGVVLIGIRHLRVPALERVGDASYGIYLLHAPIVVLVTHNLIVNFPSISLPGIWTIGMAAALTGSFSFGWLESKMHSRIKKLSFIRVIPPINAARMHTTSNG